jgi:hypothetical protein
MSIHFNNQFFDYKYKLFSDLIRKIQKKRNEIEYPDPKQSDILTCILCGTEYTRGCNHKHVKTARHKNNLVDAYENFEGNF